MSQDSAAGESKPGTIVRSLIEVDLLHSKTQLLVDTGAKLSCVSEQLLQCNELFKDLKIRKSDRRAYGVNGEPVVTLGIVDLTFKVDLFHPSIYHFSWPYPPNAPRDGFSY